MEKIIYFIFKPIYISYFLFLLLFILTNAEDNTLFDEELENAITLKMKGPLEQYGFFYNNSEGYCFKGVNPSKIIVNGKEFRGNISDISEFELGNNTINLIFEKTISNFSYMFYDCDDILEVDLTKMKLIISSNLEYMFSNCKSLTSVKFFKLEDNDFTCKLNYMFSNCSSLTLVDLYNISISKSKTYIYDYKCSLYMNYMFSGCTSLNSINISNMQAKFLYMEHMFSDCNSLSSIKIYNISIYRSYNMSNMFIGCSSFDSVDIFNFEVWDTLYMNNMFNGCISLNSLNIINIEAYDINMKNIFYHCTFVNSINIGDFHIGRSFNAYNMFNECIFYYLLNIYNIYTDGDNSYFYMNYMFNNCRFLGSVNLSNFYSSSCFVDFVFNNTFNSCSFFGPKNVFNIKLEDVSEVLYMNYMFQKCYFKNSNNIIDIKAKDTSIKLYMNYMFSDCISLNSNHSFILDLNGDYSRIEMSNLFNNCKDLTFVNFSNVLINLNYSDIFMNYMFKDCSSLISVDFSNFVLTGINSSATMNYMFLGCKNLKYINFKNCYFNISLEFISPFDDIPENIAYCIDEKHSLYTLLSKKGCSILDCSDNWLENQKKIIFKNNTCIDNCKDNSLVNYNNFCFEVCPEYTYKVGFICKDCYPSCESCQISGTEENHNCIECKNENNFIYYKSNTAANCYQNYSYGDMGFYVFMNDCPLGYLLANSYLFDLEHCYFQNINNSSKYMNCYQECDDNYDSEYNCYINCPNEFPYAIMNIQNCKYYCYYNDYFCFFDNENDYKKEKKLYNVLERFKYMIDNNFNFKFDQYILFEEQGYSFIITTNQNKKYKNDFNNIKFKE